MKSNLPLVPEAQAAETQMAKCGAAAQSSAELCGVHVPWRPLDGGQAFDLEPDRMHASRARAAAWDVQVTSGYALPCYGRPGPA